MGICLVNPQCHSISKQVLRDILLEPIRSTQGRKIVTRFRRHCEASALRPMILQTSSGEKFFYRPKNNANISKWPKHATFTFKTTPETTGFQGEVLGKAKSAKPITSAEDAAIVGLRVSGVLHNYRSVKGRQQGVNKIGARAQYINTVIWNLAESDTDGSERPTKGDSVSFYLHLDLST